MNDPRIYLAVDNCFASKRWTAPADWMRVIRDLGLSCVEASADTECDPLYMGRSYLKRWTEQVWDAAATTGVKVVNLYSGHGTYATLGLAHTEAAVRQRFLTEWLYPMSETAGTLNAGLGFFCHAFPDAVLQNPEQYAIAERDLFQRLAELAEHAAAVGCATVGVEQMYTPHQIPWTIKGAEKLLREVNRCPGSPFYLTVDVGHQGGQRKFLRPGYGQLKEAFRRGLSAADGFWLGPQSAYAAFATGTENPEPGENAAITRIEHEMDRYPYLFAAYEDGDPYLWLEALGGYSPIIHLQQTAGQGSAHLPFTAEHNRTGIITGDKILRALLASYRTDAPPDLPPRADRIYLTLEIFGGTAEMNRDLLRRLRESVAYWRTFIPEDGLPLTQLLTQGINHHE